jgi:hypothetical protein
MKWARADPGGGEDRAIDRSHRDFRPREGEALALAWGEGLDRERLRVVRTLERDRNAAGRLALVPGAKSAAGVREVPLPPSLSARLRRHFLATGRPSDGSLVFVDTSGGPVYAKARSHTSGAVSFDPRACLHRSQRFTTFATPGPCGHCGPVSHQRPFVRSAGGRPPRWCMPGTAGPHSAMSLPALVSSSIAGAPIRPQSQLETGTKMGPIGARAGPSSDLLASFANR